MFHPKYVIFPYRIIWYIIISVAFKVTFVHFNASNLNHIRAQACIPEDDVRTCLGKLVSCIINNSFPCSYINFTQARIYMNIYVYIFIYLCTTSRHCRAIYGCIIIVYWWEGLQLLMVLLVFCWCAARNTRRVHFYWAQGGGASWEQVNSPHDYFDGRNKCNTERSVNWFRSFK